MNALELNTHGVYRVTRNPIYVGLACVLLAWAAFLAVPWVLIGPFAFVAYITRFQIVPEEHALVTAVGEAYRRYRASVRRWL